MFFSPVISHAVFDRHGYDPSPQSVATALFWPVGAGSHPGLREVARDGLEGSTGAIHFPGVSSSMKRCEYLVDRSLTEWLASGSAWLQVVDHRTNVECQE